MRVYFGVYPSNTLLTYPNVCIFALEVSGTVTQSPVFSKFQRLIGIVFERGLLKAYPNSIFDL